VTPSPGQTTTSPGTVIVTPAAGTVPTGVAAGGGLPTEPGKPLIGWLAAAAALAVGFLGLRSALASRM